jgi:hypothetical protein
MSFFDLAKALSERGIPAIRLREKTKIAFDSNWPSLATTDLEILKKWDSENTHFNCAAVAKAESGGFWFLEQDEPPAGIPSMIERIESETGQKIPPTFKVRSRKGRGHIYFRQTPESIAMGNIAQGLTRHGDFSARVKSEYVGASGSTHPITGTLYETVCDAPIADCPPIIIEWLKAQRIEKEKVAVRKPSDPKIPHGKINGHLVSYIGKLINSGTPLDAALVATVGWANENCDNPNEEKVLQEVRSMYGRYPLGSPLKDIVLIGGKIAGSDATPTRITESTKPFATEQAALEIAQAEARDKARIEGDTITANLGLDDTSYPKFPSWVFVDTSIYKGLVKPFCDVNSRHEEFMFMPAMCILLNYVARKVRLENSNVIPSLFLACIGKRGQIIKSSCAQSAMDYFEFAGMLGHDMPDLENANGRQLVFEVGSPEGLGIEMARTKCSNAVLFYDEMTTLAAKTSIQSSSLRSRLLTMYESGKYQNLIKSRKESFSFQPGSYCVSLILCTPTETFRPKWAELNEEHSGFDDRFFLLLQPKVTKPMTPPVYVHTQDGALETRRLIDKAIQQNIFRISNRIPLQQMLDRGFTNRQEIRAEKFALAFAIDLGRDEVDEDCVERGIALVEYERAVKKYMHLFESVTKEGNIQQQVLAYVEEHGGLVEETALEADLGALKYGTSLWSQSYSGLVKGGYIRKEGTGKKGDPVLVRLLKKMMWGENS